MIQEDNNNTLINQVKVISLDSDEEEGDDK